MDGENIGGGKADEFSPGQLLSAVRYYLGKDFLVSATLQCARGRRQLIADLAAEGRVDGKVDSDDDAAGIEAACAHDCAGSQDRKINTTLSKTRGVTCFCPMTMMSCTPDHEHHCYLPWTLFQTSQDEYKEARGLKGGDIVLSSAGRTLQVAGLEKYPRQRRDHL